MEIVDGVMPTHTHTQSLLSLSILYNVLGNFKAEKTVSQNSQLHTEGSFPILEQRTEVKKKV